MISLILSEFFTCINYSLLDVFHPLSVAQLWQNVSIITQLHFLLVQWTVVWWLCCWLYEIVLWRYSRWCFCTCKMFVHLLVCVLVVGPQCYMISYSHLRWCYLFHFWVRLYFFCSCLFLFCTVLPLWRIDVLYNNFLMLRRVRNCVLHSLLLHVCINGEDFIQLSRRDIAVTVTCERARPVNRT